MLGPINNTIYDYIGRMFHAASVSQTFKSKILNRWGALGHDLTKWGVSGLSFVSLRNLGTSKEFGNHSA